jgi:hypothetical protein
MILLILLYLLLSFCSPVSCQKSSIATDSQLPKSEFTEVDMIKAEEVLFGSDVSKFETSEQSKCPMEIELIWTAHVEKGIYSTANIVNSIIDPDPASAIEDHQQHQNQAYNKLILVPGFNEKLTILDSDGVTTASSPISIDNSNYFHSTPLTLDYNGDGVLDYLWTNINAEVYIFDGGNNDLLREVIHVPKLRVKKTWYKGLKPGPKAKRRLLHDEEEQAGEDNLDQVGDGLTPEARESLDLFTDNDEDIIDSFTEDNSAQQYPLEPDNVWVDAHVLTTPALVDINDDGQLDLILSVSYYFDQTDFEANPHLFTHIDSEINIKNYVAGGIVALDLYSGSPIWSEHLDLTTDATELRANIYCTPTVVDLDGDGHLEVVVGTSLGFIYVLRGETGAVLPKFPLIMSEIQAQIAVEDVNHDGILEMIAIDQKGNVLCFNKAGETVWSRQISGFSAQSATIGDINGDSKLDVVIATVSGHIYALQGTTGEILQHFPIKTSGRIVAPITLVNLDSSLFPLFNIAGLNSPFQPGLHLVFPCFDGHIYIIDGRSGCSNKIDIGEHSYGQILADDLQGNGRIDLLATTMNGNVFVFGTQANFHSMKAWRGPAHGRNVFISRSNYHGVYFTAEQRERSVLAGSAVAVEFVILDNRPSDVVAKQRSYNVSLRFDGQLLFNKVYSAPGLKKESIRSPPWPAYSMLTISMENEHRQFFEDSFAVAWNEFYYRTLKYLVVLPVIAVATAIVFIKPAKKGEELIA